MKASSVAILMVCALVFGGAVGSAGTVGVYEYNRQPAYTAADVEAEYYRGVYDACMVYEGYHPLMVSQPDSVKYVNCQHSVMVIFGYDYQGKPSPGWQWPLEAEMQ